MGDHHKMASHACIRMDINGVFYQVKCQRSKVSTKTSQDSSVLLAFKNASSSRIADSTNKTLVTSNAVSSAQLSPVPTCAMILLGMAIVMLKLSNSSGGSSSPLGFKSTEVNTAKKSKRCKNLVTAPEASPVRCFRWPLSNALANAENLSDAEIENISSNSSHEIASSVSTVSKKNVRWSSCVEVCEVRRLVENGRLEWDTESDSLWYSIAYLTRFTSTSRPATSKSSTTVPKRPGVSTAPPLRLQKSRLRQIQRQQEWSIYKSTRSSVLEDPTALSYVSVGV